MGLSIDPIDDTITVTRGDDQEIRVTIRDADGNLIDGTGASFRFTVKRNLDDDIAEAVFQLTQADFIDVTDIDVGIAVISLPHEYSEALAGEYVYDFQMTLAGKVRTLLPRDAEQGAGAFRVPKNVTTPGTAGQPSAAVVIFPGGMLAVGSDGTFYFKDVSTLLWQGYRVIDGSLINSSGQSPTIPFWN